VSKKFYWLKLPVNFFDQIEIKLLRKVAGGDTFTIIYLKLLLLSLENNGRVYFEGYGSNVAEELSVAINEDFENVLLTLQFLQEKGLLHEVELGEYELQKAQLMLGSETSAAERKRRQRERDNTKKIVIEDDQKCDNVTSKSHLGHVEIEIEKEIELDIENKKICASDDEKKSELEKEFDLLWKLYPNKKNKKDALRHYKRERKTATYEEVEQGVVNLNAEIKYKKTKLQYVPHGSTWFNGRMWENEYEVGDQVGKTVTDQNGIQRDAHGFAVI